MAGRRRSRSFKRLDGTLPGVLRQLGLERTLEIQRLLETWPKIVDEKVSCHTRAVDVERRVLLVAVDNPVWMTELRFLKGRILRRIGERFRPGLVRDIRFIHRPEAGR